MRRRLLLVTNGYPFNRSEATFIAPELDALCGHYDVSIVAALEGGTPDTGFRAEVPAGVEVFQFRSRAPFAHLLYGLLAFVSPEGWREFYRLAREGFTFGRLRDIVLSYGRATRFRRYCARQGWFKGAERFDLFYSFWLDERSLGLAFSRVNDHTLRVVSRVHRYDLYNEVHPNRRQPFQRRQSELLSSILFIADGALEYFESTYLHGESLKTARVNYLGVPDPERTLPRDIEATQREQWNALSDLCDGRALIVSCSRMVPVKRLDLLAESLDVLEHSYRDTKHLRWIHFGDGPEMDRISEITGNLGINVELAGYVDNELVVRFMRDYRPSVFVNVSESEGSPVSVQEALACSIPVVLTDCGASSELCRDNGVLLGKDPTAAEVAAGIHQVLSATSDEVEAMREASRRLWALRLDQRKNKAALLKILSDLN